MYSDMPHRIEMYKQLVQMCIKLADNYKKDALKNKEASEKYDYWNEKAEEYNDELNKLLRQNNQ